MVLYMNLLILLICWLPHCFCIRSSYGYCHNHLGLGYNLLGPTMGTKIFLSQIDRTLPLTPKGHLPCRMVLLLITCLHFCCVWVQKKEYLQKTPWYLSKDSVQGYWWYQVNIQMNNDLYLGGVFPLYADLTGTWVYRCACSNYQLGNMPLNLV